MELRVKSGKYDGTKITNYADFIDVSVIEEAQKQLGLRAAALQKRWPTLACDCDRKLAIRLRRRCCEFALGTQSFDTGLDRRVETFDR